MLKRISSLSLVLVLALTLVACGGPSISALKGAVQAFSPLISILISKGTITQAQAKKYTDDGTELVDAFGMLQTDWNAAKTGADKAAAIQSFANRTAVIATDFGNIPQLATAMAILNTTLAVIEAFYGGGPPTARPGTPQNEKELADYINKQSERLKQTLQSP